MNKKLFVLAAFSALVLTGCPNNTPEPEPAPVVDVTSVSLDKTVLNLSVGEVVQLNATVTPEDATDKAVSWTTSDANIASVSTAGEVTALKVGGATITVAAHADATKKASCRVNITNVKEVYDALKGLGDKVKAEIKLSAGQPDKNGDRHEEELTFHGVMTPNYNVLQGFGGIAKFHVDEEAEEYRAVFEKEGNFSTTWGTAYNDFEEFEEGELPAGIVDQLKKYTPTFDLASNTYAYADYYLMADLVNRFHLEGVTSQDLGNVKFKAVTDGVEIGFYYQVSSTTPVVAVKLTGDADIAYPELATYLVDAEVVNAPIGGDKVIVDSFHNKAYTTAVDYTDYTEADPHVLIQHEYVTPDTYTRSNDVGFTGKYASYAQTIQYRNVPAGYSKTSGVYAFISNKVTPEEVAADIEAGTAYTKPTKTKYSEDFWYTPGYMSPNTFASQFGFQFDYGPGKEDNVFITFDQIFQHEKYAGGFSYYCAQIGDILFDDNVKYIDEDGAEVTKRFVVELDEDFMSAAVLCFGLFDIYDPEQPEFDGYIVDEYGEIGIYPTFNEGETAADDLVFYGEFMGRDVEEAVIPSTPSLAAFEKEFYGFGETVDPFANAMDSFVQPLDYTFKVDGAEIETLYLEPGQSVTVEAFASLEGYSGRFVKTTDSEVATVTSEGVVTAVASGNTYIVYRDIKTQNLYYLQVSVVLDVKATWSARVNDEKVTITVSDELTFEYDGAQRQLIPVQTGIYKFAYEGSYGGYAYLQVDGYYVTIITYIEPEQEGAEPESQSIRFFPDEEYEDFYIAYDFWYATLVEAELYKYLDFGVDGYTPYVFGGWTYEASEAIAKTIFEVYLKDYLDAIEAKYSTVIFDEETNAYYIFVVNKEETAQIVMVVYDSESGLAMEMDFFAYHKEPETPETPDTQEPPEWIMDD